MSEGFLGLLKNEGRVRSEDKSKYLFLFNTIINNKIFKLLIT